MCMKKVLIIFFFIFLLLAAAIYFFIPGELLISKVRFVKAKHNATYRFLSDRSKWHKWWPSAKSKDTSARIDNTVFNYKNVDYIVNPKMVDVIGISIKHEDIIINSIINIVPLNRDSVALEWKSQMGTSLNPLKRINAYFDAEKIKHDMADILESLKRFLEKQENIYGLNIKEERVKDTLLIATKYTSNTYPTLSTIYLLIKNLRDYISLHDAAETNYPMLHVMRDSSDFKTMVAIPVNKVIPQNNQYLFKRMIPGKILVTEVEGGKYTADEALRQLERYISDNHLSSPAIPFQSLITDRSKEPDTGKWVTKIYYPIY